MENWIRSVADQAKQESKLDGDYKKIKRNWKLLYLTSKQVGESKIWQLEEPEKKIEIMNECMINLQKILGNQYAEPLRQKAEKLYKNISSIEEIIDEMILVEKKLKIADELLKKEEFKGINLGNRFEETHKEWRKYVRNQSKESLNSRYIKVEKDKVDFLSIFQTMNKNMDSIMYDFEIKIEEKQEECPRLFFLSNKEYIRILINSQVDAKKLDILTSAMKKCFASVKEIITCVENDEVFPIGVISLEGEVLKAPSKAKNKVADSIEKVFPAMEELFKKELKTRIKAYVTDYAGEKSRSELLLSSLAQVAMIGEREIFTANTEIVIDEDEGYEDNMKVFFEEQCLACAETGKILSQGPAQITGTNSQTSASELSESLSETKRIALSGIIIQYVHFRDIIDYLLQNDAHGANSFFWQVQLKNYRQQDGTSYIKQMDACFEYGCEYLGVRNASPITPNVERCWLSYTSALRNRFWSTVVGPPDMGKQNTIQDLSSALGKFFFLYVCNRDTTARVLEKLIIGTVSSFGWTVFEKANELQYGVLSAFAYHLLNLRQNLLNDDDEWHPVKSRTINLCPKSSATGVNTPYHGFFLLVDHTSENKIEVPHTIKYLFRPVSVTVLELAPLAESFLFSFGFKDARNLGYKLAFFLKSAKDQLSIDGFTCDFGWRTLSTIVKTASALKRKFLETIKESQILYMAIQALFRTRLNEQALAKIEKISQIVYEEIEIKNKAKDSPAFANEIIEKARNNLGIQYEVDIANKLIELNAAFAKSFAVVIVGEAACGKSVLIDLFNECFKLAAEATQEKCETIKIFPKSFNLSELYGRYENKDWLDGIFVHILQTLTNANKKLCFNILHCDGPLDPQWVEHLQAGFDGERKMSLANGDFIFLKNDVKVLFEVEDLKQASPSLISRSSIIFMQNDLVTPRNIINKWLAGFKEKVSCYELISEILIKNIEELFYNGLRERGKISKLKDEAIKLPPNVIALTFCNIFETTFLKLMPSIMEKEKHDENMKKLVGKTFVFALAWSLGGCLSSLKVKKIEDFVDSEISIGDKPKDMMCFDAFLRTTQGIAEWASWADYKIPYENPPNGTFTQIIVPTKQLMRYFWFVDALATKSINILLFGESGSGKSLVAAHALMQDKNEISSPQAVRLPAQKQASINLEVGTKAPPNKFSQINVCFTWHTTPGKFQKVLEERLEKKRKNLYSAPTRKRVLIYIDDVNIPQEDNYGTMPVVEYLRGILDKGGFYDKTRYFWKQIRKTSFLCTASPALCGRKELSLRFYSHFCTFYVNTTSNSELHSLFETVLMEHFGGMPRELISTYKIGYLESLLEIYDKIKRALPGSPRYPHYMLTVKDLGKIVTGFLLGKKENLVSPEQMCKLFLHEHMRVYQDRYITEEHKALFVSEIDKVTDIKLNPIWKFATLKPFAFSTLVSPDRDTYLEVADWHEVQKILMAEQDQGNKDEEGAVMIHTSLVFFKEAVEYIIKVARLLVIPRSNLISISPQTLGRRSLIDITSFMLSLDFKTLDYNMRDFTNKYHKLYKSVIQALESVSPEGAAGVVLMAKVGESRLEKKDDKNYTVDREYEITSATIMEDISHLLSTGDFRFIGETMSGPLVRDNLHIILNIPNVMQDVWRKMRMYPCLFSECSILYQEQWPLEASVSIAQAQLVKDCVQEVRSKVSDAIVLIQKTVEKEIQRVKIEEGRKIVIAPGQGKEIANTFVDLYEQKSQELDKTRNLLEKATENVELIEKLEVQFDKENQVNKPEADKLKSETDAAVAACVTLEYKISKITF